MAGESIKPLWTGPQDPLPDPPEKVPAWRMLLGIVLIVLGIFALGAAAMVIAVANAKGLSFMSALPPLCGGAGFISIGRTLTKPRARR